MRLLGVLVLLFGFSGTAAAAEPIGEQIRDWWEDIRQPDRQGSAEEVSLAVQTLAERVDYIASLAGAAVDNASTPELRELAADMEVEYLALSEQLSQWAQENGVTFEQMPERYAVNLDELSTLQGEQFDTAFLELIGEESMNIEDDIDAVMEIGGRNLKDQMRQVKRDLNQFDNRIDTLNEEMGVGMGQGAEGRQDRPGSGQGGEGGQGGYEGGDRGYEG
ncbi:MAG: DUF4142 domain-containing protein, partial [Myxococcota bacterium]